MIFKIGDVLVNKSNKRHLREVIIVHEHSYTLANKYGSGQIRLSKAYVEAIYMLQTKLHRLLDEDNAECYNKETEEK